MRCRPGWHALRLCEGRGVQQIFARFLLGCCVVPKEKLNDGFTLSGLLLAQVAGPQLGSGYDWFMLLSRILHILGAIILVGGTFYLRAVLIPVTHDGRAGEGSDPGDGYFGGRRAKWAMWVGIATLLLLATGFWNYIRFNRTFALHSSYHMVMGMKMLLGIALMFIAALVAGRSPLALKVRNSWRLWLNVCLVLAVLVVALGAVLRTYPRTEKLDLPPPPTVIAP
jgi:uncharacterized membrane protein